MRRRTVLRRCTAGFAAISAVGLAGCSGSDDSGDSDDQPSETPAPDEQMGPTGSVGQNTVDRLEIVAIEAADAEDQFTAAVTVRNTGEQTTDIFDYGYTITLYDESGADITGSGSGSGSAGDTEVAPGEQATLNVFQAVEEDPSAVATFEVTLSCEGMFVEGVYCE